MRRIIVPERPYWRQFAEEVGFTFHSMYGEPYWDETRAYKFSLKEIEGDIEDPTTNLHAMCMDLVADVVKSERDLQRLAIPEYMWDHIAASWRNRDPHLYGRFDLAYDGAGPAKMLEYNADTPTSLYESASFQWVWLEHMIELGAINATADQFNSIHETLVERLQTIFPKPSDIHFSADAENEEDRKTVAYLEDVARVAGHRPHFVDINAIGVDAQGRFADADSFVIEKMFKLYPLEYMFREDYGQYLGQGSKMTMLEPLWKGILSNKGMLALLWEKFAGHPNLLPTYFENEGGPSNQNPVVRKPLFSREGENVEITNPDGSQEIVVGEYGAEGHVLQAYTPIPKFGDDYMVIGSWVVGDKACGIGIREDATQITKNSSRFIPHFID